MTAPAVIATSKTSLRHRVRLVHKSTGETIRGVRLAPVRWPAGWSARVIDGEVVVASRVDAPAATVPSIDVVLTDGVLRRLLVLPAPVVGQAQDSVRIPLTDAVIARALAPVDMVFTVTLVAEGTGAASTGKTVSLRPSSGASVALGETSTPGTYSSDSRSWGVTFTPADLRIGTTTVRKVSLDFTRTHTHITVVDPT